MADRPLESPSAGLSPGSRLSASAPVFTPSNLPATFRNLPIVVGGPNPILRRKKSNIDLQAVSENASRRRSREFADDTNVVGPSTGIGQAQEGSSTTTTPAAGAGAQPSETGQFEVQVAPDAEIPVVSLTEPSPPSHVGRSAQQAASSRNIVSRSTMRPGKKTHAQSAAARHKNYFKTKADRLAAQRQVDFMMYQKLLAEQGFTSKVDLPFPMTHYPGHGNVASLFQPQAPPGFGPSTTQGPSAQQPKAGPSTTQMGSAQVRPQVDFSDPIQFPPLGVTYTAQVQAIFAAQVHNTQQQQQQAQQSHLAQQHSAEQQVMQQHQDSLWQMLTGGAGAQHQLPQETSQNLQGANPFSSSPNPFNAQLQRFPNPPPGFQQPLQQHAQGVHDFQGTQGFQGGVSEMSNLPGAAAGQYRPDVPPPSGPRVHPFQGQLDEIDEQSFAAAQALPQLMAQGLPQAPKQGPQQGTSQRQRALADPQAQARAAPHNKVSSSKSKPANVKAAAKAAAAGQFVGGTWYPAGKSPAELKNNGGMPKGGMGTPFATPFKPDKSRPAPSDWLLTDYELTGKWNTLPEGERTPPTTLRANYFASLDDSELTQQERFERDLAQAMKNSLASNNLFGNSGGQGGQGLDQPPVQYNTFGRPIGGGPMRGGYMSGGQMGGGSIGGGPLGGRPLGRGSLFSGSIADASLSYRSNPGIVPGVGVAPRQNPRVNKADHPKGMSSSDMGSLAEMFKQLDPSRDERANPDAKNGDGQRDRHNGDDEYHEGDEEVDSDDMAAGDKTPRAIAPLADPDAENPSVIQQRFERKTKPAPLDFSTIPLAEQLGFGRAVHGSDPILPSALPTRHVSHGVTNILDRGAKPTKASVASSAQAAPSLGSHPAPGSIGLSGGIPQGTVVPHMWKSDNQAVRDDFKYVSVQAHHLGFDQSPAFPQTASEFANVRADQMNRAADLLSCLIEQKEVVLTPEGRANKAIMLEANAAAQQWAVPGKVQYFRAGDKRNPT